jgi:hypothetical protein
MTIHKQIKIPPGGLDEHNKFEENPGVCEVTSRL